MQPPIYSIKNYLTRKRHIYEIAIASGESSSGPWSAKDGKRTRGSLLCGARARDVIGRLYFRTHTSSRRSTCVTRTCHANGHGFVNTDADARCARSFGSVRRSSADHLDDIVHHCGIHKGARQSAIGNL